MRRPVAAAVALSLSFASSVFAQAQSVYTGSNVTGQLVLTRSVNLMQQALMQQAASALTFRTLMLGGTFAGKQQKEEKVIPLLRAPSLFRMSATQALGNAGVVTKSLSVNSAAQVFGFDGLTHAQQRLANRGNQFSVEPPSQGLAVAGGYALEGVNNAVQVYRTDGTPLLPAAVSTNQLFGLEPAIDRATGINGVFPTDIRVFFDQTINRWFVLQRAQHNDQDGNLVPSSALYLAVSQTSDPTATYNIYVMDTTNSQNFFGCPCFSDYLQIGADQYGFYITANEYNAYYPYFVDATILAISKTSLAAGVPLPTAVQFTLPSATGYEFAIQPATTPPGASYFLASGGVEYFVSSQSSFAFDNHLAVWAMTNTSLLLTSNPDLRLARINITSLFYGFPDVAVQKPGILVYGSTLTPPGKLAFLDGSDSRVLSLCYSGGRLYLTFATQVTDDNGFSRVGGAYVILSPSLRAGKLAAPVLRQGYLKVNGNHLLRPAVAVNPQGRGAIVFTLVGADHYPSAAFLPIDTTSTSTTIQIARPGAGPEDGFSGYLEPGLQGVARWGDYSVAVAAADGSIWLATEYIPNAFRTLLANWGTYLIRYIP